MTKYILLLFILALCSAVWAAPNLNESGIKHIKQNGYNPTSSAGDDVWSQDGAYSFPTDVDPINAVSSSANDAAAGTGCRTVVIEGLDESYNYQTETVTMNGATPVFLSGSYIRVNRAYCATVGTGGVNAGALSFTVNATSAVLAHMPASQGRSQQAIFSVPADKPFTYLDGWDFSVGASTTAQAAVQLQMRTFNGSWQVLDVGTGNDTSGIIHKVFGSSLKLPPKADIKLNLLSVGTSNHRVNGGLEILQRP